MPLSLKQNEYLKNCNHRWNIKTGATRSGKTLLDYVSVIPQRIEACSGDGLIFIIGNSKNSVERNVLNPMRELWPGFVGHVNQQTGTVKIWGKQCFVMGADKINQVARIQGAGLEYCYGDEVTTWNEEVFQMLKSRLDKPNSTFDGTCNPDHPSHWFKKFLESDADIYQQSYTIDDNPFLSAEFVDNLKKEYAGTVYYDRYILGRWALADGLVYPMFNAERHTTNEVPDDGLWYISIDYGTVNPFSAGLWCMKADKATRVKEFYYDSNKGQHQKTDEEYYTEVEKLADGRVIQAVVVDPSAASFIACIHRHRKYNVLKANNEVLKGIRNTAAMLNAGMIKIHTSCKDSIREFGIYSWDTTKAEDAVIKEYDHAMDDIRYFCQTILYRNNTGRGWAN